MSFSLNKKSKEKSKPRKEKRLSGIKVSIPLNKKISNDSVSELTNKNESEETKKTLVGIKLNKSVNKKLKKNRFLAYKMYKYKLFNFLMRGRIDSRSPNLSGDSIQIGYADVITLKTFTRYVVIYNLPNDAPVALKNHLNSELKTGGYWVQLSLVVKTIKYSVDFSAQHIQSKIKAWQRRIKEETLDVYNGDGDAIDKSRRMLKSFLKLKDNQGRTKEATLVLKLQTRTKEDMVLASDRLQQVLDDLKIKHYTVKGNLLDFLRGFITISRRKTVTQEGTSRLVMTNRDIVELLPYMQGKVGSFGLWFGFDKLSGCSVWLNLRATPDAKNVLITAIAGAGKTFIMRVLLMFHNALLDAIFIHDHKGNEFIEYTKSVGGTIISMTPSRTSYISFYKIPIAEAETEDELLALYKECYNMCELEFLTLTEPKDDEKRDYKRLFSDFYRFVHKKENIESDNVSTYYNSIKLNPEYLYELYYQFITSHTVKNSFTAKVLLDTNNALYHYWHPKGQKREYFRNEVTLEELTKSRVVCFDFGMATTTKGTVSDNEMKLKTIYMRYGNSRFNIAMRKKGLFIANVIEEIQSADDDILMLTHASLTEGRAQQRINYVIGNTTGAFSGDGKYASGIRESISVRLLGALNTSAREFYVKAYDLQRVSHDLDLLSTNNDYKYHFLLDTAVTGERITSIISMEVPDSVASSVFLKTVDVQKDPA